MATKTFADQENRDVGATFLSKDQLKLSNSAKPLLKGKVLGSSGSMKKTVRKALGNVNRQTVNQKAVPAKNVKKTALVTKKVSEPCEEPNKQSYPEIEKIFTYNPEDFETFDVLEEHKLSHVCLAGVPLFMSKIEAAKSILLYQEPAPMDIPDFNGESDVADRFPLFLMTLDKILPDLPPMNC